MHHPLIAARAVLALAALIPAMTLMAGPPGAAYARGMGAAQAPCAARSTSQIIQPPVPRPLSMHHAPLTQGPAGCGGHTQTLRRLGLTGRQTSGMLPAPQSGGWQLQAAGGAAPGTPSLRRIACPTVSRCVAVGEQGIILTTTDAGTSWHRQHGGTQQILTGVACPTVQLCSVVGTGTAILATADGGQTWQPEATPAPASLMGIACPSDTHCIAVGDAGALVLTTDGGHTWHRRSVPHRRALASVTCPGVQLCYAVGPLGAIVATRDGGQSWQDESLPLAVSSAALIQGGDGLANPRTAARAASQRASAGDTPTLTDVACPTRTTCYASGGQVALTTDGRHWQVGPLQTPAGGGLFWSNGAACLTPSTCYLVGAEGASAMTRDGGRSWHLQTTPTTATLYGIACRQGRACYAVGDQQTILVHRTG